MSPPAPPPPVCREPGNSSKCNLALAALNYSNLGALGPDIGRPAAIHLVHVGRMDEEDPSSAFDLLITNASRYDPYDSAQNKLVLRDDGRASGFATINLRTPGPDMPCESSVRLRFDFVWSSSGLPVAFPKPYRLTVVDLDKAQWFDEEGGGQECVQAANFTEATTDTWNNDGTVLESQLIEEPAADGSTRFCAWLARMSL